MVTRDSMNPSTARDERPRRVRDASCLLVTARRSFTESDLDDAVRCAEDLFDLAVWGHDPAALAMMASAMPFLDSIFSARLGPRSGLIRLGAPTDSVKGLLSLPALELLSRVTRPMPIHDVIAASSIPERDCVRLLAGLLRRKVLVSRQDDGSTLRAESAADVALPK
jgi:hypothetical protein